MNIRRLQHLVQSNIMRLVSLWVVYISYTQTPAEAFIFPQIIATAFLLFALCDRVDTRTGIAYATLLKIAPGLGLSCLYIFWAMDFLGFYTSTALAFFGLLALYDPAPHTMVRSWVKRLLITVGCISVIYLLFAQMLNVYTPRALFI